MKTTKSRIILTLVLFLVPAVPVYAELGATLLKVNAAIVIVTKARDIQKKYQGPDAAPIPLHSPTPTQGGTAQYVSPFTAQGQVTEWAQMGMKASAAGAAGAQVGGRAAQLASGTLFSKVPVPGAAQLGGFFNKKATEKAAEVSTAMAMGGWENIRAQSDVSFATADELAVYMHANHVEHPDYPSALAAAIALYPEVEERYEPAVEAAVEYAKANPAPARTAPVAVATASPSQVAQPVSQPQPQALEVKEEKSLFSSFSGVTSMFSGGDKKPEPEFEAVQEEIPETAPEPVAAAAAELEVEAEAVSDQQPEMPTEPEPLQAEAEPMPEPEAVEQTVAMLQPAQPPVQNEPPAFSLIEQEAEAVVQEAETTQAPDPVEPASASLAAEPAPVAVSEPEPVVVAPAPPVRVTRTGPTVEERLTLIVEARKRGELSGDEYLAERQRIIYGE